MKILAIDDNQDNLTTLQAVVHDGLPSCTLMTALNPQRGLELALAQDPDVILLDIIMPGMDGYEVCRRLKADERSRLIPVVFMTSLRADRESRIQALHSGAEGFLSKPMDELELVAMVRAMAKIKEAALLNRDETTRLAGLVAERTQALQQSKRSLLNTLEDMRAENEARRQTETALRKSDTQFRTLTELLPVGVYITESNGDCLYANPAWCRMAGLSLEEALGLGWVSGLHPDDRAMVFSKWQQMVDSKGQWGQEYRFQDRDGKVTLVYGLAPPQYDDQGRIERYVGVNIDITGRKQAEQDIARQMDELRRWQAVMLGREGRVGELKREVNALAVRLGEPPPYASVAGQ
jgi:PAS domain S-box-containing protein